MADTSLVRRTGASGDAISPVGSGADVAAAPGRTGHVATAGHGTVEHPKVGPGISYNPDAPSEEWGWHGSWRETIAPRGSRFLLWLGVVGLLLLQFGNHVSNVENWWMVGLAALMALWLILGEVRIRKERARRP